MTLARYQLTVTDNAGNVVPNANVEVRREAPGQPLVALFSDRAGESGIANPTTTDDSGYVGFHIAGGAYQIRAFTGPSATPTFEKIWNYVPVGRAQESDGLGVGVNAIGDFADRDDYDDEAFGFVFLSEDGDGEGNPDAVLFVKRSAASGDWSDAIYLRGVRGGDRYEFSNWDNDRPASGEEVIAHLATITIQIPAAFAGSQAKALVAATADAIYSIKKNGTQIGTLTFPSGNTTGAFVMSLPNTLLPGDRLSIVSPNPRDSTLSGVAMTLVANR